MMRTRNLFLLAIGALCAAFCALRANPDQAPSCASLFTVAAYAQDDDPFGDDAFDEDGDAADSDAEDPFGAAPTSDPFAPSAIPSAEPAAAPAATVPAAPADGEETAAASDDPRAQYLRPEDVPDELKTEDDFIKTANPVERAILGRNPTNSAELFSAAASVARVGRPLFAKMLAEKALQAPDASPEDAAKILDELGAGRATYFVAMPEASPAAAQAYEKVLASARQSWESEKTIRDAIARASGDVISDQAAAILDLRRGGSAAVSLLVSDLLSGDGKASAQAANLLPFFESDAIESLLAAVRDADADALEPAVKYLGEQTDLRVGPELLGFLYCGAPDGAARQAAITALAKQYRELPTESEFALDTYRKALGYFNRTTLFGKTVEGTTERWSWNAEKGAPVKAAVPTERAYLEETAYLAQTAYRAGQKANAVPSGSQELAIVATSELELANKAPEEFADALDPLQQAFPEADAAALTSAIRYALDASRSRGALLAVLWLREIGDESLVYSYGEPSVIVQAATCPDRLVRFQAISAIMKWNPQRSYVGSVKVGRMLEWFASSTGSRVAVVASPKLDECSQIGALLQQQGYRYLPATTGRDAIIAAQSCADVEFVLVSPFIGAPDARVIAQTLRADARTADVPLFVATSEDGEDTKANLLVGREPNAFVYQKPYDLQSSSMALQRLFDYTKPNQISAAARAAQGQAAANAFLALSQSRPDAYEFDRLNDLTRKFLATPEFFEIGLEYAATVKTNYAQTALVDMIGDTRYSIKDRRKALAAFERQLDANGSLLRGPEVGKMYDRYNASEKEDAETQKVLSDMLDVYEAHTGK